MALITATTTHGDYGLTLTDATGNTMLIDIPADQGGTGKGMRPMQTVLAALIGCSSVDVVSILKKQRQDYTSFKIEVDGNREAGKEPSLWENVELTFLFEGTVDAGKAYRAAELSIEKYCSVAATLRKAGADIRFKVIVNNQEYKP
ncbi:OsmC family protein [Lacibacter sp. MH-610]|uniref:OsmC family protein n=1 Tax=Lacibacter sp. MH-610 TaxID=3020883 RepID=UPI0038927103